MRTIAELKDEDTRARVTQNPCGLYSVVFETSDKDNDYTSLASENDLTLSQAMHAVMVFFAEKHAVIVNRVDSNGKKYYQTSDTVLKENVIAV